MMGSLRKMKRQDTVKFPLNFKMAEELIYNRGYDDGAKEQRKSDIEHTLKFLETLEELPGIGEKTAEKVRMLFLSRFGK